MEKNPEGATFPTTHYPTPGLALLASAPTAGWRCLYSASNGQLYGVCGNTVYLIASSWTMTALGTITTNTGPCEMSDNGVTLLLVDGSSAGYWVTLSNNTFAAVTDEGFYGANAAQYADGFFILPRPNSQQFYISLANQASFDATDFAAKMGYSDTLVTLAVTKRYIFLLGAQTSEIWYNAGNPTFPYARVEGAFIQHGCVAPASVAQMDGSVYWLAQDPQGKCIVVHTVNYDAERISTHAIENEIQGYGVVSDARGFTMQMGGHYWYVLTFPTANKTWVYDLSTKQWHEWLSTDGDGNFNRHRASCFAFAYGVPIVGDWANGNLYRLDLDAMTDNGAPIVRVRSFPHMVDDNSNRVAYREFIAGFQVGSGNEADEEDADVAVFLRWSDTAGKSWGNPIRGSFGKRGDYLKSIQFQRLGMARDRVFELSWSSAVKTALNGAFVQAQPVNQ